MTPTHPLTTSSGTRSGTRSRGSSGAKLTSKPKPRPQRTGVEVKLLYTVADTAHLLSLSERMVYYLLSAGSIRSVKVGRRRYITAQALDAFLAVIDAQLAS